MSTGGGEPKLTRYGTWWDQVAGSRTEALSTTYGITDEADYAYRGRHGDANTPGAEWLFAAAGLDGESRVLEIGCGMARVGRELAPMVGEWHGADVSARLLEYAAGRLDGMANAQLHHVNGRDLSAVPERDFDFIYCTTTFGYLDKEEIFGFLLESGRLLKPSGLIYFDTWNLDHPDSFRMWRGVQEHNRGDRKERGRLQASTETEFRRYLDESGFAALRFDVDRLLRVVARFEGVQPHRPQDGRPPFGYLESPRNLESIAGPFMVQGWALDDIDRIEVRVDDRPVRRAHVGLPRPDLAPLFPRYTDAAHCGFGIEMSTAGLEPGLHRLEVTAFDGDGRSDVLTGFHHAFTVPESHEKSPEPP